MASAFQPSAFQNTPAFQTEDLSAVSVVGAGPQGWQRTRLPWEIEEERAFNLSKAQAVLQEKRARQEEIDRVRLENLQKANDVRNGITPEMRMEMDYNAYIQNTNDILTSGYREQVEQERAAERDRNLEKAREALAEKRAREEEIAQERLRNLEKARAARHK